MIVYKATNKDMICTSGEGLFQYRLGVPATAENQSVLMPVSMPVSMYWIAHGITEWVNITGILKQRQKGT